MQDIFLFEDVFGSFGGIEKVLVTIIGNLPKDKYKFHLIVNTFISDEYKKELVENEVEIIELQKEYIRNPFKRHLKGFRLFKKFLRNRNHIDTIHFNISNSIDLNYVRIAKIYGVTNRIAHSHNSGATSKFKTYMHKLIKPFTQNSPTEFLACSDEAAKWLYSKKVYKRKQYKVIYNPVDTEKFKFNEEYRKEIRSKYNIKEDDLVIGHVGRFNVQKNHTFLIDIFNALLKRKANSYLMLVGDGELKDEIINKVKYLGIEKNVIFIDGTKEVYKYYSAFDCFVLPSFYEGLGIVLIEAQCANLKVIISTKVPDIVDYKGEISKLNLNEKIDIWVKEILNSKNKNRDDNENFKNPFSLEHFIKQIDGIYSNEKKAQLKSFKSNFVWLTLYKIVIVIAPLIIAPYASRILGENLIGDYSYYMSILTYFTLIAALGFTDYGSKVIASKRDDKAEYTKAFYEIFLTRLFLGLALTAVYFILVFSGVFGRENITVYSILSLQLIAVFIDPFFLLSGLEKFKEITIRTTILKFVLILCIFLFVKDQNDFINYVIIYSFTVFISPIVILYYLPRNLCSLKFKDLIFKEHFKNACIYFVPVLSTSLFINLDKSMVNWITHDSAQNGYFEEATKVVNVILNALNAVQLLTLSRISYLYKVGDKKEILNKSIKSLTVLFYLAIPCFFGLLVINRNFIPMFFGNSFIPSTNIIYVLALLIFLIPIRSLYQSLYFIPLNKVGMSSIILLAGTLINVFLNIPLIYYFGALGAAAGTVISEFIVAIIMNIYLRKHIPFLNVLKSSKKILLSGLIMFGVGMVIDIFVTPLFENIAHNTFYMSLLIFFSCALIYFVCLILLKDELTFSGLSWITRKFKRNK